MYVRLEMCFAARQRCSPKKI